MPIVLCFLVNPLIFSGTGEGEGLSHSGGGRQHGVRERSLVWPHHRGSQELLEAVGRTTVSTSYQGQPDD